MAAPRDPWPSRSSILRFNLDAVFLSGSLNSFTDPQLVLKTQVGPLPRVPFTGNRSRVPVTRHVLMVHVKDKATELETLDLGAFTSSSTISSPDIRSCVEYLSSDHSLIFRYAKGAPRNACTLRVKFQEASDLNTVVAELRALHISIGISPSPESSGMTIGRPSGSFLSSSSQSSPPLFLESSSQEYQSASPPLIASQGTQNQEFPFTTAIGHQLHPVHLVRHRSNRLSSHPSTWPSISPLNRVTRPATAIGIPGTLGEGLYRVSKVASVPGNRTWQRRSSRLAEVHRPGTYTFSKHFDRTLDGSDIAKLRERILRQDEGSHAMLSQDSIDDLQDPNATSSGEGRSQSHTDSQASIGLLGSPTTQQSLPEYPQHTSREPISMAQPERTASQNSVRREHISRGLPRTHSGDLLPSPRVPTPSSHGAIFTEGAQTTWIPPSMRQDAKTGTTDHLQQVFQISHEGLCEATAIWDDLMEKGRKETESVDDDAEAFRIWLSYAETLARRVDNVAGAAVRKIRQASGERAT